MTKKRHLKHFGEVEWEGLKKTLGDCLSKNYIQLNYLDVFYKENRMVVVVQQIRTDGKK